MSSFQIIQRLFEGFKNKPLAYTFKGVDVGPPYHVRMHFSALDLADGAISAWVSNAIGKYHLTRLPNQDGSGSGCTLAGIFDTLEKPVAIFASFQGVEGTKFPVKLNLSMAYGFGSLGGGTLVQ